MKRKLCAETNKLNQMKFKPMCKALLQSHITMCYDLNKTFKFKEKHLNEYTVSMCERERERE